MIPSPNDLTKRAGHPNFETLNNTPDPNNTNQTIASVASTAISDEIPPLREPTAAPPQIIQFPHGYRPILKDGIIVQIPNPAPLAKKTGIHTVRDLPPEEIPGLAELRETIQESKNLADKMEKFADDMQRLGASTQQLEADQPSFETLNKAANNTTQAIATVARTASYDEVPPLREPIAEPSKTIQSLHGSRTVLQEGILVQVANQVPPVKKTGIHTVHDLPPEEIPGLAELRETIQESKELADKMEKFADDMQRLGASTQQLGNSINQLGNSIKKVKDDVKKVCDDKQEIIADMRQLRVDTEDLIQRVDKLEENSAEEAAKIAQQTAQLEVLSRYLDQQLESKTLVSFTPQQTLPMPIAGPNFLARKWRIVVGGAFCLITLVAVAAIFGITSGILLSATLTGGIAFFWKQCEDRTCPEKFSTQSLLLNNLAPPIIKDDSLEVWNKFLYQNEQL